MTRNRLTSLATAVLALLAFSSGYSPRLLRSRQLAKAPAPGPHGSLEALAAPAR